MDKTGKYDISDAELSQMLLDLQTCLMYSFEAKMIAEAGIAFSETWLVFENVASPSWDPQVDRKFTWLEAFQDITMESNPGFGSVQDKARATAMSYVLMIRLALWVTDNDE